MSTIDRVLKKGRDLLTRSVAGSDPEIVDRLERLARDLRSDAALLNNHKPEFERLQDAVEKIARAWSGGWLGYHSRVYKADLKPKQPGDYFDTEWGEEGAFSNRTRGQWREFDFQTIFDGILKVAAVDLEPILKECREVGSRFDATKKQAEALLSAAAREDEFVRDILEKTKSLKSHFSAQDFVQMQLGGKQFRTRDMRAANEGAQSPPHVAAEARGFELLSYGQSCDNLAAEIETAATYLRARVPAKPAAGGQTVSDERAIERVLRVLERFHAVRTQLRRRYANRVTFEVKDEYDVQDLLHALLKVDFEDVRPEEWAPSYAGKSTRADFLLKGKGIFIEAKITGEGRAEKQIGEELAIDFAYYRGHSDCKVLVCFVYDPDLRIANHRGFQDDLENLSTDQVQMIVRVYPSP